MKNILDKDSANQIAHSQLHKTLADSIFNAKMSTPTIADNMSNIAQQSANDIQGRMANGNGHYLKAFLRGFGGGAKMAGDRQRQDFIDKYGEDVIVPLMRMNETAREITQKHQENQQKQQMFEAHLLTSKEEIESENNKPWRDLPKSVRNNYLADKVQKYNDLNRTNYRHLSSAEDGSQILFDADSGRYFVHSVDTFAFNLNPEASKHMLEQKKAATQAKAINDRSNSLLQGEIAGEKTRAAVEQKEVPKLKEIIDKTTLASRKIDNMLALVEGNEDVFNSQLMNIWMSEEPSMLGNALKTIATKISPEKSSAITKLNKYINELVIDKASLFTRPNMFIEKVGSKAVPNWMMTADAFKDMLHEMKADIDFTQQKSYKTLKSYGISDVASRTGNEYIPMKTPSGKIVSVPLNKVTEAEDRGAVRV